MKKKLINLRDEFSIQKNVFKTLDFKIIFIFVTIAIIQTISYYYSSRRFFRFNLYQFFVDYENIYFIEYIYWLSSEFIVLFIIPILLIKFFLKEKLSNYGIILGDKKIGFSITIISILVMLPILWFVSSLPGFINSYPQCSDVKNNWLLFLIYEFCFFLYMIGWEFVWRGYMLFGLKEKFGYYAIFIQMIPFTILHNGKPELETFSAIIAGIFLGILAIRTGSFWYGVFIHTTVMFSIDLISTIRYKTQVFGIGINSIIEIIKKLF
ncbi:MAG TPA: CPBP family intramembrane glutamic endopeptidase [Ignavibacteria bacterium]